MTASILALSSAVPSNEFLQEEVLQKVIQILSLDGQKAEQLKKLYAGSSIRKRHSVIPDFKQERSKWDFWGSDYPKTVPGMTQRNEVYKKEAPKLAFEAAKKALDTWGGQPSDITHLIFVSCTGMVAPGIEFNLLSSLDLLPSVNRLGINFMGCFGAFKGLSVANAFALQNPHHRVLVVCTELCSLHFQSGLDNDTLTANCIFSDGASAAVVGAKPQLNEKPLWDIVKDHSWGMGNSLTKMSWEASDHGFLMKLSSQVPVILGRHVKTITEKVLGSLRPSECDWAIHPGGKSILQAIEQAMQLEPAQTEASWDTLSEYGNMSSATFLFVLERLYHLKTSKQWSLGLGFGPGLSFESILLRKRGS